MVNRGEEKVRVHMNVVPRSARSNVVLSLGERAWERGWCSLFQALGEWGGSKKRPGDERRAGSGRERGEVGRAFSLPLLFLPDPVRPAAAFSIVPTDSLSGMSVN